jgi:hypothetical protein
MTTSCISRLSAALSLAACASLSSLEAATVSLNSTPAPIEEVDYTSFNAKIRVSNNNWDKSLGSTSQISTRNYSFTIENVVGQGIMFRTTDNQNTPVTQVLAFGSGFGTNPGGLPTTNSYIYSTATNNSLGGLNYSTLPDFNSLLIQARASETSALTPNELVSIQSISFTSPTLNTTGSLNTGNVTSTTPGNGSGQVIDGQPVQPSVGIWQQRIVGDTSLKDHNWKLSGNIVLQRAGSGGDEGVSFIVSGQQLNFDLSAVPEPSRALLLLLGGVGMVLRRRRAGAY